MSSCGWIIGFFVSFSANLIIPTFIFFRKKLLKRSLSWFWSDSKRPFKISFSTISGFDDPSKFRTKRIITHIGDAQAAALIQSMLQAKLKKDVELFPNSIDISNSFNYVNIGGPIFNKSTENIFRSLEHIWKFPFKFEKKENGWAICGNQRCLYLNISKNREVLEDYGLIAKLPHPKISTSEDKYACCIVLAGLSMFGTLGAAKFIINKNFLKTLKKKVKIEAETTSHNTTYFMAIIKVNPSVENISIDEHSLELFDVKIVSKN